MARTPPSSDEQDEAQAILHSAFELARRLGIKRLLVQAKTDQDIRMIMANRDSEQLIWITKEDVNLTEIDTHLDFVVHIPESPLSRMSQIQISLFLALLNTDIKLDERLVCLYDLAGSTHVDSLFITTPKRNFPWLRRPDLKNIRELPALRHFERLMEIALRFAAEGREGRPIGTIFVLGETKSLSPYLRQLILNPCVGHAPPERDLHNPNFMETLREFTALDGAFVISNSGVIESAGTYLDAPIKKGILRRGLGARHAAAMAITGVTPSFAIAISESSGTVTVFHRGRITLELEKPEAIPHNSLSC